jgi:subtilisin-like proprotein convertase family protein
LRAVGLISVPEIQVLCAIVGTGDWRLQVNDFSEHAPPEDLTGALALWIVKLAQEHLRQASCLCLAYEHERLDHLHHGAREHSAVAASGSYI